MRISVNFVLSWAPQSNQLAHLLGKSDTNEINSSFRGVNRSVVAV